MNTSMTSQEDRAREIQEQIRQILLHDWDPVGVRDQPSAQREYDSYVGGLYRLLAEGASTGNRCGEPSAHRRRTNGPAELDRAMSFCRE
jgi:hypothetical protein